MADAMRVLVTRPAGQAQGLCDLLEANGATAIHVPAIDILISDLAYGISRRRVTVSTSGLVPTIDRLGDELVVRVFGTSDLILERRALAQKGDLFEDVYGMRIRLEEA